MFKPQPHPKPQPNLRAFRTAHRLTQAEAAAAFGVSQGYWAKLELGQQFARPPLAAKLEAGTGVPLTTLLGL